MFLNMFIDKKRLIIFTSEKMALKGQKCLQKLIIKRTTLKQFKQLKLIFRKLLLKAERWILSTNKSPSKLN